MLGQVSTWNYLQISQEVVQLKIDQLSKAKNVYIRRQTKIGAKKAEKKAFNNVSPKKGPWNRREPFFGIKKIKKIWLAKI